MASRTLIPAAAPKTYAELKRSVEETLLAGQRRIDQANRKHRGTEKANGLVVWTSVLQFRRILAPREEIFQGRMAAKRHKKVSVRLAEDFRAPIGALQAALALRIFAPFVAKPFRVFVCGSAALGSLCLCGEKRSGSSGCGVSRAGAFPTSSLSKNQTTTGLTRRSIASHSSSNRRRSRVAFGT